MRSVEEEGVVIEIKANGRAKVRLWRHTACNHCPAASNCEQLTGKKEVVAEVMNEANARVGEKVIITLAANNLVKASFIVYFIPLATFAGGMLITDLLLSWQLFFTQQPDLVLALGGFMGLGLGFVALKWYDKSITKTTSYLPIITQIVAKKGTDEW